MRRLTLTEIEKYASRRGARRIAVENFLGTLPLDAGEAGNRANLYGDVRLYSWNAATVAAIEAGIKTVYKQEEEKMGHWYGQEARYSNEYNVWAFASRAMRDAWVEKYDRTGWMAYPVSRRQACKLLRPGRGGLGVNVYLRSGNRDICEGREEGSRWAMKWVGEHPWPSGATSVPVGIG